MKNCKENSSYTRIKCVIKAENHNTTVVSDTPNLQPERGQQKVVNDTTVRVKCDDRDLTEKAMRLRGAFFIDRPFDPSILLQDLISLGIGELEANSVIQKTEAALRALKDSGVRSFSTSLIRSITNDVLRALGINKSIDDGKIHIGIAEYDEIVMNTSKDNANFLTNNPEMVAFTMHERINKQLVTQTDYIFSDKVRQAHNESRIYLHDSGQPSRFYCHALSLAYIAKYGLDLPTVTTTSAPAKHCDVLLGHLKTYLVTYQSYFAGALGLPYFNIFFAPYIVGMSNREVKQLAQKIAFGLAQTAFGRGTQSVFIDLNINFHIPEYLKNTQAILPGGIVKDGVTYGDFEKEAQLLAEYMMEVYGEGDRDGNVFPFPKLIVHVDDDCYKAGRANHLLKKACELVQINGSTYFVFDRGNQASVSMCCRVSFQKDEIEDYMLEHPEHMRFVAAQNVSINLPQAAYRAKKAYRDGNGKTILAYMLKELEDAMALAFTAHTEKKKAFEVYQSPGGPLYDTSNSLDQHPYVDLDKCTWLIGVIGLNNAIEYLCGDQMHESDDAFQMGMNIIKFMNAKCMSAKQTYGINSVLEETPGETACSTLAENDSHLYSDKFDGIKEVMRGQSGYYYYESGAHLEEGNASMLDRIRIQSEFSPYIPAGSIIHIWLGESKPHAASVMNLVQKVFEKTQAREIAFTPDIAVCKQGHVNIWNRSSTCPLCGDEIDYYMSRIVGYYARVDRWNDAKRDEFKKRKREEV